MEACVTFERGRHRSLGDEGEGQPVDGEVQVGKERLGEVAHLGHRGAGKICVRAQHIATKKCISHRLYNGWS